MHEILEEQTLFLGNKSITSLPASAWDSRGGYALIQSIHKDKIYIYCIVHRGLC